MLCKARWTGARYELLRCFRMDFDGEYLGSVVLDRVKIHWIIGFSVQRAAVPKRISSATPATNSLSKCTAYFPRLFGLCESRVETERSNVYLISPLKFYSAGILDMLVLFTMLVLQSSVSVILIQSYTNAMCKSIILWYSSIIIKI